MTDERFDVVVIGAGHNGLAAAAVLAKAGRHVVVLERSEQVGGASITREFADGYAVSAGAQWLYQLQPAVRRQLGLSVPLAAKELDTIVLAGEGEPVRYGGGNVTGVSDDDRERFARFSKQRERYSRLLWNWLNRVPPRLGSGRPRDTRRLIRMALDMRLLGKREMREFLRLVGMNIYDDVVERFSSPLLQGGLCLDAVLGSHAGPRSPGTYVSGLYRLGGGSGAVSVAAGGMGSVANAFMMAARDAGADIRTGAGVERIVVRDGRVAGVELAGGERIRSNVVMSSVDPKQTVLSLTGARYFETGFVRRVSHIRAVGNAAKLHLALDGLPGQFDEEILGQRLLIAPGPDAVEAAFNPAKYGQYSAEPVLDISIPSIHDETLAPNGCHVLSATAQYAPYDLEGGWTEAAKRAFLDTCMATIDRYLPGTSARVIEGELLTPVDLEAEFGTTGGHWHHAELALDQFFVARPVGGAQQYRAPLDGLYFCGAGAHPGGGVTGAPGRNAALALLNREADR